MSVRYTPSQRGQAVRDRGLLHVYKRCYILCQLQGIKYLLHSSTDS